jgi:hypothetical protein
MQTNVQGINQFFSALGNAFAGPNAMDIARASVLGAQRGNYEAETRNRMLQGDRLDAQNRARLELQGLDFANPEMRGQAPGLIFGGYDNPAQAMPAVVGASTIANPNAWNANDLSNVLMGAGVVNSFQNTPAGYGQYLDAYRDVNQMKVDQRGQGGASPSKVPFTQMDDVEAAVAPRLATAFMQAFPDAGITADALDPSLLAVASDLAAQNFAANGGNAQIAVADSIAQVLANRSLYEVQKATEEKGWLPSWVPFIGGTDEAPASVRMRAPGAPAAPVEEAPAPQAAVPAGKTPPRPQPAADEGIGQQAVQQTQQMASLIGQRVNLPDGLHLHTKSNRNVRVQGGVIVAEE